MTSAHPTGLGRRPSLATRLIMSTPVVVIPNPASKRSLICNCRAPDLCPRCSQQRFVQSQQAAA
jgi:hypothetical protein